MAQAQAQPKQGQTRQAGKAVETVQPAGVERKAPPGAPRRIVRGEYLPRNDTPCPKCGERCDLVPGIIVNRDPKCGYVICWHCNLIKETGPDQPWQARKLKSGQVKASVELIWRECSPYHRQAVFDGDLLDWWPTAGKFRWRGVTRNGDPRDFIAARGAKL